MDGAVERLLAIPQTHLAECRAIRHPTAIVPLAFEAAVALITDTPRGRALLQPFVDEAMAIPYAEAATTRARARRARDDGDKGVLSWEEAEEMRVAYEDNHSLLLLAPCERTLVIANEQCYGEWRVRTTGRLPPWPFVSFIADRSLLECLAATVDFDRPLPDDSRLREYLRVEAFTPANGRRASQCTEQLIRFLHAAADPAIRVDRRRARRLPVLCALAARRRRPEATASDRDPPADPPTASLVSICLRLATLGTTRDGACDGALWRLVVAFV